MNASINDTIYGFRVTDIQDVPELNGRAYIMRHEASGARLIYLENEDIEKVFSISFKTMPVDDTGVFHILEHSLLCGSKRYPVKEPFTRLLKTSMKTFLNAFTAPDYTSFPVATTNQKDLENLANVYLDAVLNPLATEDELVFRQEGWHLEAPDGTADSLSFSGVVMNEMKGALSSPIQRALTEIKRAMFPGGTYSFVSGGDPASIPNLSFEQFADTYRRHYRLDNSYCTLYGKMDVERMLKLIDESHFTPWLEQQKEVKQAGAPNEFVQAVPLNAMNITMPLSNPEESPMIMFSSLLPDNDPHTVIQASVVVDALFGTAEAPAKAAILATGMAGDVVAICLGNGRQPQVVVLFLEAQEQDRDTLLSVMVNACRKAIETDEFREQVQATTDALEFAWRAGADQHAGVEFTQDLLAWWMDGHENPLKCTRYEEYLAGHSNALAAGRFEEMARLLFIDCEHKACIAFAKPEEDDISDSSTAVPQITDDELEDILSLAQELNEKRLAPDSPEALATLPLLRRSDLDTTLNEAPKSVSILNNTTIMRLDVPTNGIDHAAWYFDLAAFSEEDLLFLSLMCSLIGELPTKSKTAAQVQVAIKSLLGNMELEVNSSEAWNSSEIACCLAVQMSALESKVEQAMSLAWELLLETDFHDIQRVKSAIECMIITFEHTLVSKAVTIAVGRAKRSVSRAAAINEKFKGVESCMFLENILEAENGIEEATGRIEALREKLFSAAPALICTAGSDKMHGLAKASSLEGRVPRPLEGFTAFESELPQAAKDLAISTGVASNVAVFAPTGEHTHTGHCMVAEKLLQYEYLWQNVRVAGGAYVVAAAFDKQGLLTLASGRDPHIDESYAAFANAGTWLAHLECTEEEIDGYVISTMAERNVPRKPDELIARAGQRFISKRSDEQRAVCRQQILETTVDDLREVGRAFEKARLISSNTVANSQLLDASSRSSDYDSLA